MTARLPATALDSALALERVGRAWDEDILRQLTDYIRIPAKSPMFAPDWETLGFIDTVLRNAADWVAAQKVPGLRFEIVRQPGRTPVLFFEVDGTADRAATSPTVLMYGHLDKQPAGNSRSAHDDTVGCRAVETFCQYTNIDYHPFQAGFKIVKGLFPFSVIQFAMNDGSLFAKRFSQFFSVYPHYTCN